MNLALPGEESAEEVCWRENRSFLVGAELEEMGIAGHETVGFAAAGTGQEMIVIRVLLDHGG